MDRAEADELLELLGRVARPLRLDDMLRFLDLPRREKKRLHALLDSLTRQGRLVRLGGGRWSHPGKVPIITGLVSVRRSGGAFVTPDRSPGGKRKEPPPDVLVLPAALGDAWHGDRVEVAVVPSGGMSRRKTGRRARSAPRREGRVLRVLERRHDELVVRVLGGMDAEGRMLCRPVDSRFPFPVLADVSGLPAPPETGTLLLVAFRPSAPLHGENGPPSPFHDGTLSDSAFPSRLLRNGERAWIGLARLVLGQENDVTVQERLVRLNHDIPDDFPPSVLAEAARLAPVGISVERTACAGDNTGAFGEHDPARAIPFRSTPRRQDLRALPFVTIDGDDARDFDDAIHVLRLESGWELWVAIADVSHFVRPGSALDREARRRGNSCYFPTSVSPMLPEILSGNLCSLRPGEDRAVLAVRLRFDADGLCHGAVFLPGLIRSRARLTYDEVQAALDAADTPEGGALLPRFPGLRHARDLARVLRRRRDHAGGLDFDIPEARFVVDRKSGRLLEIRRRERLEAHRLVEACMLAANEAVAGWLSEKGAAFPYRVHPDPDPDRLTGLFRTLAMTGLAPDPTYRRGPRATEGPELSSLLRRLLAEAPEGAPAFLVSRLVLRAMMQARYAPERGTHFGLASSCYCHFTSPIRRYADLLTHRALCCALRMENAAPAAAGRALSALCEQCNARERAAVEAEREITRRLGCLLLRDRVGEIFSGIISGVSEFGIFVELDENLVEGMILPESLGTRYAHDHHRQEWLGPRSLPPFRMGQKIRVRLASVHLHRLEVTLEPLKN